MSGLFWGPGDFPLSYSNKDTSWNAWNRPSGSFMFRLDTGILFSKIKYPSHSCLMTFWSSTSYSDSLTDQTFQQFHDLDTDLDLHWIASGFHVAFATGVACQQRELILPDTWFPLPFLDLLMPPLLRPVFLKLYCIFSTFHLEYLLVLSRFWWSMHWLCRDLAWFSVLTLQTADTLEDFSLWKT